ncbi:MAG: carboxypeptidase-like regulatory domain-containing protein, partial [Acidobacteriia bacterium]|nr:carboxypeptidase-like regulatory domain-containing protein [Terriglobia bacterium]
MRTIRAMGLVFVLMLAVMAGATVGWAQTGTTSLRGTISDKSGAVVVGAKVTLANPAQAFQRESLTGESGQYEFQAVPPGTYVLTVEMAGFRKAEQKNLQLLVNTPATMNVTLVIGAATETVEVTAQAEAINTADATLGIAFGESQVKQLPMEGRNVPDLLTLQAGVVYTGNRDDISLADTRSGSVNGARSDQSNITLDGVDVNDQVNGTAFTSVLPVTLDSVQEFRVTTTGSNADAGRSSGAQVALVTKSGTNNFHGSLYEYHRNTITSANDYFVKQAELTSGDPNVAPKLIRNIFGGSVGGPVMKDRLFFFANFEGYRKREESSVVRVVPSDALRDGVIQYQCQTLANGNPDTVSCPGGTVQGMSGATYTVQAGNYALNNTQLIAMDPLGIGMNSVVKTYFNTFPHSNDQTVGDSLNFQGYRFRGAVPTNNNWYIARLDYKLTGNGNHTIFARGAVRNDVHSGAPYLPGTSPLQSNVDYSKGITLGYTAILRSNLVNNFRWGFTRQSIGILGNNDSQPFIFFRGLNDNETAANSSLAVTRSHDYQTPVNNFVDDISWSKSKHTYQFGTNIRFIRNPRKSFQNSFSGATTNSSGLNTAGIANTSSPLDPANNGYPAIDGSFGNSYNWPIVAMMGIVSEADATFNYDKNGNPLPLNSAVQRRWGANEFEFYFQDSYKVKSNLTVTYGLRYSLFSPPWETTGTEVAPTFNLGDWFQTRANNAAQGIGSNVDPAITFDLAGAANGRKGYYDWDLKNFGPRLAFAYTPGFSSNLLRRVFGDKDKTVIRGGFGIVYDRVGAGLLNSFDQYGSFGLSTQLTNSVIPSVATAPRVTGLNIIPQIDQNSQPFFPSAPQGGFPYTPPPDPFGLAIQWGLDSSIRTPYSYTMDFSVGRDLGKGFSVEVSYVGRLSHRLLAQEDLAMPLNLVDTKTGITYFQAARRLSELAAAGTPISSINAALVGSTAAYWQDMIAPLVSGDSYAYSPYCANPGGSTADPIQAVYDSFSCMNFNETTALWMIDQVGNDFSGNAGIAGTSGTNYYPTKLGPNAFFNQQFKSLYAWRSKGNANYHAMQVNIRKKMAHGVQFDFNYTFSKSIDIFSDAERVGPWSGLGGQVINSWDPNARRAVSDFNLKHQINANWIVELPFGKGKLIGKNVQSWMNAVIGDWQLSGLARLTSGFPVSVNNGATWPTNWQLGGGAVQIGPFSTGTTYNAAGTPAGSVSIFTDPNGATGIQAFRHAYP